MNSCLKVTDVFPASKFSVYLMDGLKSKNAKQRAEILDHIGHMVKVRR